jgi:hypothetical protein
VSHRKKYQSLGDVPFFNVNSGYVKMDASEALRILEDNLRGEPGGYLSPDSYSALCSLANVILVQDKKIRRLTERISLMELEKNNG